MSRRAALLAIVATVAAACSSFGSASDAGPTDGGQGGPDGGNREGATDRDGTTNGFSGIPDASYVGCSAIPGTTFCDDFDSETDFTKWFKANSNGAGQLDFDSKNSLSSPKSFLAKIPINAPTGSFAYLEFETTIPASSITADFDLFPVALGDADTASVLEIVVAPGSAPYRARLNVRTSELSVLVFNDASGPSAGKSMTLAPGIPLGRWAHVTFTLELSADGKSSSFSVSVPGLAAPLIKEHIPVNFPSSPSTDVQIGLDNLTKPPVVQESWTISFDNVAITVK